MPLERLIQRILADAKDYADKLINDARLARLELLQEAEPEAERKAAEIIEAARASAIEEKQQRITSAVLEARREILEEKHRSVQRVIDRAVNELKTLPRERYLRILVDQVLDAGLDERCELILSEKDRVSVGDELVERANREIRDAGGGGEVFLSGETREITGGLVVRYGETELNYSLEARIESRRELLNEELVRVILAEQSWQSCFQQGGVNC